MSDDNVLRVENLLLHFRTSQGVVQAVDDVSLSLGAREAIVVLGEYQPGGVLVLVRHGESTVEIKRVDSDHYYL